MTLKSFEEAYQALKDKPTHLYMSIMLAQWALESSKGTSELAINAHNYSGHKTTYDDPNAYWKITKEYDGRRYVEKKQPFKRYASDDEWANAHAGWLTSTPTRASVYKNAIQAETVEDQAKTLTGTYATDPLYDKKILDIIERYNLRKYDKEADKPMATLRTPKEKITLVNSFGRWTNKPKYIVIHYVGAEGQAKANADYFYSVNRNASAHIFIDRWETWRVGYDDMAMWHVGDGNVTKRGRFNGYVTPGLCTNYNSIGIEMCQTPTKGLSIFDWPIDEVVVEQTLLQTIELMKKYNIPFENVIRHYDVSTKLCPAPWRHNDWEKWKEFKAQLAKMIGQGDGYNPQGLAESKPETYTDPTYPFAELKKGETVTILDDLDHDGKPYWKWYDPANEVLLVSGKQKELAGKQDKIADVYELKKPVGHSKRYYKLKKYNSFILEEYLEEAKKNWTLVDDKQDMNADGYAPSGEDYIFLHGKKYAIGKEIK